MLELVAQALEMLTERQMPLTHVVRILKTCFICDHELVGPIENSIFAAIIWQDLVALPADQKDVRSVLWLKLCC